MKLFVDRLVCRLQFLALSKEEFHLDLTAKDQPLHGMSVSLLQLSSP